MSIYQYTFIILIVFSSWNILANHSLVSCPLFSLYGISVYYCTILSKMRTIVWNIKSILAIIYVKDEIQNYPVIVKFSKPFFSWFVLSVLKLIQKSFHQKNTLCNIQLKEIITYKSFWIYPNLWLHLDKI